MIKIISTFLSSFFAKFWASLIFYTALAIPQTLATNFAGIAAFAPLVGVLIGVCLGAIGLGLYFIGMPDLTTSAVMTGFWILITGGLHLDGVMDAADGLAVTEADRRLEVMADSKTGAFGVMAGVMVILLKTAALNDINHQLSFLDHINFLDLKIFLDLKFFSGFGNYLFLLINVCAWSRFGQLLAIWRYPYLRAAGKGKFLKESITSIWDLVPSFLLLICLALAWIAINPQRWILAGSTFGFGGIIAVLVGAWFNHKLSGHTGDTYGAVVEWTEALLLCVLSVIFNNF